MTKFKSVTLNFLFITIFISVFQLVFGPENSIVAIALIIIMSSAMLRDLTSTPVKQFFIQLFILESMAVTAFLVTTLPLLGALAVNFLMLLFLLYTFTFEYATHLYMPYILSYLFLLFISPVNAQQLLIRLLGMLVGAACVMAYQLVMGRNRIKEVPRQALVALTDEAVDCVRFLLLGGEKPDNPRVVHKNLCKLSRLIFERRKRTLCISDASFAMLECGRVLERLILLLSDMKAPLSPQHILFLQHATKILVSFRDFLLAQAEESALLNPSDFSWSEDQTGMNLSQYLTSIRGSLLHMTDPDRRTMYRPTATSVWTRLKAALNVSSVRVVYSLRVATLLAAATAFVQFMDLPHGKWLLFTLASVSLPYAEDVGSKAQKRLFATVLGGCLSIAAFTLISDVSNRSLFMMFAGYLTAYFTDYKYTFACSTIGALGGAMLTQAYGFEPVAGIVLIRLGYICIGIVLAYVANCLIFPFKHPMGTHSLLRKHIATRAALQQTAHSHTMDCQLYFSLVIQLYLQEETLYETLPYIPSVPEY